MLFIEVNIKMSGGDDHIFAPHYKDCINTTWFEICSFN